MRCTLLGNAELCMKVFSRDLELTRGLRLHACTASRDALKLMQPNNRPVYDKDKQGR